MTDTQTRYDCKTCGGEIEWIDGKWYHSRIEDWSHQAEPAATYHGIVKAVCLNCGEVTRDVTALEILNDAPPGPDCLRCGVHDILWTMRDGKRQITQDLDDEGTKFFDVVPERRTP